METNKKENKKNKKGLWFGLIGGILIASIVIIPPVLVNQTKMNNKINDKNLTVTNLNANLNHQISMYSDLNSSKEQVERKLANVTNQLKSKDERLQKALNELKKLTGQEYEDFLLNENYENASSESLVGTLRDEIKKLKAQKSNLNTQIETLTKQNEDLNKKLQEALENLAKTKNALEKEKLQHQKDLDKLELEIAKLSGNLKDKDTLITKQQTKILELENNLKNTKMQRDKALQQVKEAQEKIKELETNLNNEKTSHQQDIKKYETQIKDLEKQLENEKLQHQKDNETKDSKISKLETEIKQLKQTLAKQEATIQELQTHLETYKAKLFTLVGSSDKDFNIGTEGQNALKNSIVYDLRAKITKKDTELGLKNKELENAKNELSKNSETISSLRNEITNIQTQLSNKDKSLKLSQTEINKLKAKYKEITGYDDINKDLGEGDDFGSKAAENSKLGQLYKKYSDTNKKFKGIGDKLEVVEKNITILNKQLAPKLEKVETRYIKVLAGLPSWQWDTFSSSNHRINTFEDILKNKIDSDAMYRTFKTFTYDITPFIKNGSWNSEVFGSGLHFNLKINQMTAGTNHTDTYTTTEDWDTGEAYDPWSGNTYGESGTTETKHKNLQDNTTMKTQSIDISIDMSNLSLNKETREDYFKYVFSTTTVADLWNSDKYWYVFGYRIKMNIGIYYQLRYSNSHYYLDISLKPDTNGKDIKLIKDWVRLDGNAHTSVHIPEVDGNKNNFYDSNNYANVWNSTLLGVDADIEIKN